MAAGEMSPEEFAAFNRDWMSSAAPYLVDGGLIATFIDWRSVELVLACGRDLGFELVNIVVWSKSNAGQGSLWRSQHELLPIFKSGSAPPLNNVELGRFGRWRSNVWRYPGASSVGSDAREGLAVHPAVEALMRLASGRWEARAQRHDAAESRQGAAVAVFRLERHCERSEAGSGREAFGAVCHRREQASARSRRGRVAEGRGPRLRPVAARVNDPRKRASADRACWRICRCRASIARRRSTRSSSAAAYREWLAAWFSADAARLTQFYRSLGAAAFG